MIDLTTTSTFDDVEQRGFTARGRSDIEEVFRRAMRHSRLVRVLRIAIPVGLVVLVGVAALATWLDPMRMLARLPATVDRVVVEGTKITMAAPKLSGFTRDSRRYDLSARSATQDVTKPDLMELEGIRAEFETPDKMVLNLSAANGLFNRKTGLLTLRQNVLLVSSNGYEARLTEVAIDTATGKIVSDQPVQVKMLEGDLRANRLEVLNSGEVLGFDNGVTLTLHMKDQPAAAQP